MYTLGIDIGSSSSKVVIIDETKTILDSAVVIGGAGTTGPARVVSEIFDRTGLNWGGISKTVATGYGRLGFTKADKQISEISCHALGVHHLVPTVKTIIDIGGQDVKAMSLTANGLVSSFLMNDKCAAGTGRFLDVMAKILEIDVSEMGSLSGLADQIIDISNTCTVFAESEVISHLASGVKVANVAAGIHQSVARRVASLAFRVGVTPDVVLTGGVALNQGIVKALSSEVHQPIIVAPQCQLTGAIGAAMIAMRDLRSMAS
jgi:(R)-2-hydroxyacyl-CoA dehydratese activating ATPase